MLSRIMVPSSSGSRYPRKVQEHTLLLDYLTLRRRHCNSSKRNYLPLDKAQHPRKTWIFSNSPIKTSYLTKLWLVYIWRAEASHSYLLSRDYSVPLDLMYFCWIKQLLSSSYTDLIWVLGRDRELPVTVRATVYNKLSELKLDSDRLVLTRQKNCPAF